MQQFVCTVAVTELRGSPEVKRRTVSIGVGDLNRCYHTSSAI